MPIAVRFSTPVSTQIRVCIRLGRCPNSQPPIQLHPGDMCNVVPKSLSQVCTAPLRIEKSWRIVTVKQQRTTMRPLLITSLLLTLRFSFVIAFVCSLPPSLPSISYSFSVLTPAPVRELVSFSTSSLKHSRAHRDSGMTISSVRYNSIDASEDEEVIGKVTADPYIGTRLGTAREQYCAGMSNSAPGQAGEALKWIEEATKTQLKCGYMLTGELPGSVLQALVMLCKAERVLEIGAYTGYSAVAMAATGAKVTTIDSFEDEAEAEAIFHEGVKRSGLKVALEKGKALDVLARLEAEVAAPFDLIFVDAEKREQIQYYEFLMARPKLWAPTGAICVDNTLWYSRVMRPKAQDGDDVTQSVMDFNRHVRDDPRSFVSLLPLRDGLTIIQRRRE